ncbi:tam domain methyltransferase protein [Pyrenophora tritici-repentis]|nr:tam domain methyltransferase protein [Pyrenophora tritici-repentis]KAI1525083.1 tam domain methyltransferase protein [Pyrenophora tritici-repentis]KAI1530476.1 tam domain methyltransferase protein [Pyrenophora tritici-repentis]KAI1542362.1 tam domain methyltransferase protein [Pyrenophora tritici-repentis]KAI1565208.1 tam domain methyltransferase protein [Pyrenophora tritici-repentis]
MDKEPPQPDHMVAPHTAAPLKRPRADSESSASIDSIRSFRTLTSDDVEYVHENGRTYGNDTYYMPCVYKPNNDFAEQDRLSLQHEIFLRALKGKLTTTRLLPTTRRILDLGTGPGHWAISMARQYPHAEVVGIDMVEWDIETTEATLGNSTVTWELDDLDVWGREINVDELVDKLSTMDLATNMSNRDPLESPKKPKSPTKTQNEPNSSDENMTIDLSSITPQPEPGWHFSDSFDFIHLRNLKGTFTHWEEVYTEIYNSLNPGGWIEVVDWDLGHVPSSTTPTNPNDIPLPTLRKLYVAFMEASFKSGRPLGLFYMHPSYLEEAGFEDIQTTHVNVPVGQWANDEAQKSLGKMMFVLGMETFEPVCLRLLTRWGSGGRVWTAEELREDVARAQDEIRDYVARSERGEVEGWCASFKWVTARKSWHAER